MPLLSKSTSKFYRDIDPPPDQFKVRINGFTPFSPNHLFVYPFLKKNITKPNLFTFFALNYAFKIYFYWNNSIRHNGSQPLDSEFYVDFISLSVSFAPIGLKSQSHDKKLLLTIKPALAIA
jgi:hypothetical protein